MRWSETTSKLVGNDHSTMLELHFTSVKLTCTSQSFASSTAAPEAVTFRALCAFPRPISHERPPHVAACAAPPDGAELTGRYLIGGEVSVLAGMPLASDVGREGCERVSSRDSPTGAERTRANSVSTSARRAGVGAGAPDV
jgi:hypothetical protein